jgi:hypothetical protein
MIITLFPSTLSTSISTLLRCAFGDFDYNSVVSANRVLGPVFFFMWLLYAAVILLNMAIAIISEAFVKVKTRCTIHVFVFVEGGTVALEWPCAVIVFLVNLSE